MAREEKDRKADDRDEPEREELPEDEEDRTPPQGDPLRAERPANGNGAG